MENMNMVESKINEIDNKYEINMKKCRVITCIHCVGDVCANETCEIYERSFIQEG
ncbi:hypothetical protein [Tepidibacter aestuarii]|uniref:hypothetical protein n=1 Tax=Tepidibacter aestuarii TaxID=2925782 RepID=UPI0020C17A43|nr:hypothetical protein [Tepidibacter aestuarii]CAH2214317.1 protein of unknown function [Tepidibacter aestuarii]